MSTAWRIALLRFWCQFDGHKLECGHLGAPPYLKTNGMIKDSIGCEHWYLFARCRRCQDFFHVGNIHGPL